MTNEQKFSPEWGFEPGVVVEITTFDFADTRVGYLHHITDIEVWYTKFNDPDKEQAVYLFKSEIKSLRILSGPWAVWQFAQDDVAGIVYETGDGAPFAFYNSRKNFESDKDRLKSYSHYIWMPRPWWLEKESK